MSRLIELDRLSPPLCINWFGEMVCQLLLWGEDGFTVHGTKEKEKERGLGEGRIEKS